MGILSWLFGTKVEPNWYPPMPEDKVPQTPYRTAPYMSPKDKPELDDNVSSLDIKSIFNEEVIRKYEILSDQEKAFFTENKVKELYKSLIHLMMSKACEDKVSREIVSYTDLKCGLNKDMLFSFFKMAKKEFAALDINLTWSDGFMWFENAEFIKAQSKAKVLYSP